MQAGLYYSLLVGAGFLAGFVDSIAGGGGMISLPALLLTGMPATQAVATNKLAATFGSATSTLRYLSAGQVQRFAWVMAAFGFCGSLVGARLLQTMKPANFNILITFTLIAVGCFVAFRKDYGKMKRARNVHALEHVAACLLGIAIGFYDGFIGPPTGTFLTVAFITVLGLDFLKATGSAKVVNFATNVAALLVFLIGRTRIHYAEGVVMGTAIMAGAYTGSGMAVRIGPKFIKPLFIGVALVMAIRLVAKW